MLKGASITTLILLLLFHSLVRAQEGSRTFAITNVNVIPLDNRTVLENQTVLIKDGLIESVQSELSVPTRYQIIDGTGKFLIPGFADMHAHLPGFQSQAYSLDEYFLLNLANGVTTVRGMRGHPSQLALRDSLIRNNAIAPQIFVSSPPITRQNNSTSIAEFLTMFSTYREQGYDFLKVLSLDGFLYDSLMELVQRENWIIAGHSPDGSLHRPVEFGQNSIEHIEPFVNAFKNSPEEAYRLLERMKSAEISNCPDLYWYYIYGNQLTLDSLKSLTGLNYVSTDHKRQWIDYWSKRYNDTEKAREVQKKYADDIAIYLKLMDQMDQMGIKLLVSPGDGAFIIPGFSYVDEMEIFEQAGIEPLNILKSASANAAAFFGENTNWGEIKPGYRADLILLSGNPLTTIKAVRNIEGVMVNGQWLPKDYLNTRLNALQTTPQKNK